MLKRFTERYHHKVGHIAIACLMLPVLAWAWLPAQDPVMSVLSGAVPRFIFSGDIFTQSFHISHAGSAMDQPTIGKWLIIFTFIASTSLPYAIFVGWLANRSTKAGRATYAVTMTLLCFFLLCILSWPLCWLIQYVCSMGVTPMRIYGLIYAGVGGLLVVGFSYWACRKPKAKVESA